MISLPPVADDLAARQPVWEALSDMFLDTDTSLTRRWRVERLAGSPYSIEQLELILVDEVYPVCRSNLLSVAGEWTGFDPEWLRNRIMRRLDSRFRVLHAFNLGRLTVRFLAEWRATKHAVAASRKAAGQSAHT